MAFSPSEDPTPTPDSLQKVDLEPFLRSGITIYSVQSKITMGGEESKSHHQTIQPFADGAVIYWVARTKAAVEIQMAEDDQVEAVSTEPLQELTAEQAQQFFDQLPMPAKWAVYGALIRVRDRVSAVELAHIVVEETTEDLEQQPELVYELEIDNNLFAYQDGPTTLAKMHDAMYLSAGLDNETASSEMLRIVREKQDAGPKSDYMPLLRVKQGNKIRVLVFLSTFVFDEVLNLCEKDMAKAGDWLRNFVIFKLKELNVLLPGDSFQAY